MHLFERPLVLQHKRHLRFRFGLGLRSSARLKPVEILGSEVYNARVIQAARRGGNNILRDLDAGIMILNYRRVKAFESSVSAQDGAAEWMIFPKITDEIFMHQIFRV